VALFCNPASGGMFSSTAIEIIKWVKKIAVAQAKVTHILRPGKASEKTPKGVIQPSLCEILHNASRKKKRNEVLRGIFHPMRTQASRCGNNYDFPTANVYPTIQCNCIAGNSTCPQTRALRDPDPDPSLFTKPDPKFVI
jgi:hypothetical protein